MSAVALHCWALQVQHLGRIALQNACNISALGVLQVAIFVFAVWSGTSNGGVIAGLAVAGFVMAATSSAGTLMQARALQCTEKSHLLLEWQSLFFSELFSKASGCSAKRMVHCVTLRFDAAERPGISQVSFKALSLKPRVPCCRTSRLATSP